MTRPGVVDTNRDTVYGRVVVVRDKSDEDVNKWGVTGISALMECSECDVRCVRCGLR